MKFLSTLLALLTAGSCWAQATATTSAFPSKPIHIYVTVPPGGAADFIARTVGAKLSQSLGVSVVIENRGGASGTIAAALVAKAPADGYTLLQNSITTHGIGPYLFPKLPYESFTDFAPVTLLATLPMIMTVNAALPVKSVDEFIALAKSRPGKLSFASSGNGGAPHLAGELFKVATDIDILHVPYKGSGPAVLDVAGGQVQAMFDAAPSLLPHIQSGKLRALAAASAQRNALLPEVPTFAERGVKGMEILIWYGLQAPAGTPPAIVNRLNAELRRVLDAPDLRQRFAEQGTQPAGGTPEQFSAFMREDYQRWGSVIKRARLSFD